MVNAGTSKKVTESVTSHVSNLHKLTEYPNFLHQPTQKTLSHNPLQKYQTPALHMQVQIDQT